MNYTFNYRFFGIFFVFVGLDGVGLLRAAETLSPTSAATTEVDRTKGTNQEPARLPEIVVTATRTAEDTKNIPQSVTVLTPEEIERRQAKSPNEMLREEPGIWSVQVPAQGSPILRGQIGNRVLYLWDGIRINNGALFGGPNGFFNQFPLGGISQMEVIRGPGSVQYGSDAIGGVINIISKKSDYFPTELKAGGEIYGRYGTVNDEKTETADFWLADKVFNINVGVTRQDVGDYRGPGVGVIKNTGFDAIGGYLNAAFKPLENHTLRLSWIQNDRQNVDSYSQSKLNPSGIPRIFNPDEDRGIAKLEYQMDNLGLLSSELKAYSYFQFYDQLRERRVETATALTNTKTDTKQGVFGGGIQNITPWATSWGDHRFIYGVDYRTEDLKSALSQDRTPIPNGNVTTTVPAGKVPDGTYDVFDGFAMIELHPHERLAVSTGGRVEVTHLNAKPVSLDVIPNAGYTIQDLMVDKSWTSGTWNIGAIYSVTHSFDIVNNIATGFRAPTFSDALSTGTPVFSSKTASVPSPNVEPEKFINYELGPRYHSRDWNVSLTGFWTELTDVIRSIPSGTVDIPGQGTYIATRNNNAGEGYVRGIEFAASYKLFRDWTLFGNAAYTQGWDRRFNEYYRFIPPLNGVVGLRYEAPSGRWWAEAVEVIVDKYRHHAPNDELDAGFSTDPGLGSPGPTNPPLKSDFSIPGYAVTNLRAGVKVWVDAHNKRSFDLTMDLNNVFDRSYREVLAQQELVAPGINLVLGGRLKF